jgi:hypothetical protein
MFIHSWSSARAEAIAAGKTIAVMNAVKARTGGTNRIALAGLLTANAITKNDERAPVMPLSGMARSTHLQTYFQEGGLPRERSLINIIPKAQERVATAADAPTTLTMLGVASGGIQTLHVVKAYAKPKSGMRKKVMNPPCNHPTLPKPGTSLIR